MANAESTVERRRAALDEIRSSAPAQADVSWLILLRWGAIVGQLATIAVVAVLMEIALPIGSLLAVIGVEAGSNIAFTLWNARGRRTDERGVGLVMILDVVLFTALLYLTGGSYNPFSFLYLVYIALAAVVLSPGWSWTLAVFSLACFRALFVLESAAATVGHTGHADHGGHGDHLQSHLEGMWVAFAVAAAFIVYFVQRVRRALAVQEQALATERAKSLRSEKLASLATLAAGAAHQLATPLATIAIVARELESRLAGDAAQSEVVDDARLVRDQVERCRSILAQMAADAGQGLGESLVATRPSDLVRAAVDGLDERNRLHLSLTAAADAVSLLTPLRSVAQAVRGVVKNALEASTTPVQVKVDAGEDGMCVIQVTDRGVGMSPEVLAHAGEPFFTTKGPDRGMGLGLFLAHEVFERLGGRVVLDSGVAGGGTTVTMFLPVRPATIRHVAAA